MLGLAIGLVVASEIRPQRLPSRPSTRLHASLIGRAPSRDRARQSRRNGARS